MFDSTEIHLRYQCYSLFVSFEGREIKLKLTFMPNNILKTLKASFILDKTTHKDVPIVWEGIDGLSSKVVYYLFDKCSVELKKIDDTFNIKIALQSQYSPRLLTLKEPMLLLQACRDNPNDLESIGLLSAIFAKSKSLLKASNIDRFAIEAFLEGSPKVEATRLKSSYYKLYPLVNGLLSMKKLLLEKINANRELSADIDEHSLRLKLVRLMKDNTNKAKSILLTNENPDLCSYFLQKMTLDLLEECQFGCRIPIYVSFPECRDNQYFFRQTLKRYNLHKHSAKLLELPLLIIIDDYDEVEPVRREKCVLRDLDITDESVDIKFVVNYPNSLFKAKNLTYKSFLPPSQFSNVFREDNEDELVAALSLEQALEEKNNPEPLPVKSYSYSSRFEILIDKLVNDMLIDSQSDSSPSQVKEQEDLQNDYATLGLNSSS